jgi:hypothetical protein
VSPTITPEFSVRGWGAADRAADLVVAERGLVVEVDEDPDAPPQPAAARQATPSATARAREVRFR